MNTRGAILLAEDNPDDVLMIERAFQTLALSNRLIWVPNGEEAMWYLKSEGRYADRNRFPIPCLVLLDLLMPRINGLEFLTWLRRESHFKELPVVVLTTSVFSSDVRTAYLLGANSFLTKPIDLADLTATIRQISDFWLGPCRLPEGGQQQGSQAPT